jgi:hypothetical protein
MLMIKIIVLVFFISFSAFAQYMEGNNQLKFTSGMQIKEDGEVLINKKKWSIKKKKKENTVTITNDRKYETNTWEEGPINIKRHKNAVEVKYKDIKAKDLEIEYVFQGAREEKNDIASLTKFADQKISNFTTCAGKKCLSLTKDFCEKLSTNIGSQTKTDALAKAKQCLSFSNAMASFKGNNLIVQDLKKVHEENLRTIDTKLASYFHEHSKLSSDHEFELERMIQLGDKNQDYFELLIQVINSCEKNFN